jgi:hypothetical protein
MNVRNLQFGPHSRQRITERNGSDANQFIKFIRLHQSHSLVIFNGNKLSKYEKIAQPKKINEIHLLTKYNGRYTILVIDRLANFVITAIDDSFYYTTNKLVPLSTMKHMLTAQT